MRTIATALFAATLILFSMSVAAQPVDGRVFFEGIHLGAQSVPPAFVPAPVPDERRPFAFWGASGSMDVSSLFGVEGGLRSSIGPWARFMVSERLSLTASLDINIDNAVGEDRTSTAVLLGARYTLPSGYYFGGALGPDHGDALCGGELRTRVEVGREMGGISFGFAGTGCRDRELNIHTWSYGPSLSLALGDW